MRASATSRRCRSRDGSVRLRRRRVDALPRGRSRAGAARARAACCGPGGRLVAATHRRRSTSASSGSSSATSRAELRVQRARTARSCCAGTSRIVERRDVDADAVVPRRARPCSAYVGVDDPRAHLARPRAGLRRAVRAPATHVVVFVARRRVIRPAELIQRKRDGEELAAEELARARARLRARRGARLPDGRVPAWPSTSAGLTSAETFALTDAMIRERRDDRPRRRARPQGRRQALDRAASATRRRSRSARSSPPAASRSGR